ncbi:MAG: AMP-binding protein [Alkalispirochaeta sp.]
MTHTSTLREILDTSLEQYADLHAYSVLNASTWTFREIGYAVGGIQRRLSERGIGAGDRVALLSENQPAWPAAYLAITSGGAIAVPILPDFSPAEVAGIVEHAGATVLLASTKQVRRLEESPDIAVPAEMIVLEELFQEAVDAADPQGVTFGPVTPDDTAAIIYTSGTTGHSKGVMLSHGNLTSNVAGADAFARLQPGERMLSLLPLAHTYECTLGMLIPFSHGSHVTYLDRPASPTVLSKALAQVKPHLMLSVPLLIEKLVRARVQPQLDKPVLKVLRRIPGISRVIYRAAGKKLVAAFGGELRFFGIGGAPLAPDVEKTLYRMDFPYAIGYGLTETSPLLAGTSPHHNTLRSTGTAVEDVDLRIEEGEIQARGPNIMQGYYRDPEQTAEVMTDDGWFRTGDLGEFDAKGRLYVKGRSKTVILSSNGENIYPEAIEALINQFKGVAESLVVQRGNRLVARVRLDYDRLAENMRSLGDAARDAAGRAGNAAGRAGTAAGQAFSGAADRMNGYLEEVRKEVNSRLSSFSRISDIEEEPEPFEKTPTFKIKRYLYREKE